jgi:hypothetical protein
MELIRHHTTQAAAFLSMGEACTLTPTRPAPVPPARSCCARVRPFSRGRPTLRRRPGYSRGVIGYATALVARCRTRIGTRSQPARSATRCERCVGLLERGSRAFLKAWYMPLASLVHAWVNVSVERAPTGRCMSDFCGCRRVRGMRTVLCVWLRHGSDDCSHSDHSSADDGHPDLCPWRCLPSALVRRL